MRGYLTWEGFRVQRDAGECRVKGAGCRVRCRVRSASVARGMPLECAMRLTARGVVAASVMLATGVLAKGSPPPMAQVALVPPASIGLDSARLAEATALLRTLVAEGAVAGAVAGVARRDQVAYLEAVGVQDVSTRTPMTERSLFRIYSMTKPITAVAVMMLHDQGRFRLDDPVSMYLSEFADLRVGAGPAARPPARPVTVEDLLLHTSGLSHRTSDLYRELQVRSRADTLPAFVTKITRAPLVEDPGTRFRYSEATTVLGRLVEVWSKQPFDRFLEERLLRPLKMTETRFWVPPDARPRLATVYGPGPGGALAPVDIEAVPFTERPVLIEGAVGLVSTVPDFLRFARMLLNEGSLEGDARARGRHRQAHRGQRALGSGTPDSRRQDGVGAGQCQRRDRSIGCQLSCLAGRIRVGRDRGYHLLERSSGGNRDRADDPECARQSRGHPAAIQDAHASRGPIGRHSRLEGPGTVIRARGGPAHTRSNSAKYQKQRHLAGHRRAEPGRSAV